REPWTRAGTVISPWHCGQRAVFPAAASATLSLDEHPGQTISIGMAGGVEEIGSLPGRDAFGAPTGRLRLRRVPRPGRLRDQFEAVEEPLLVGRAAVGRGDRQDVRLVPRQYPADDDHGLGRHRPALLVDLP